MGEITIRVICGSETFFLKFGETPGAKTGGPKPTSVPTRLSSLGEKDERQWCAQCGSRTCSTTRHARARGKTAIVGSVLAGARMHRMRLHRHRRRVYAPTYLYNQPYCLAIAFQPSTVYGLARLLVLCRGACLSVTFVGVHAFPRRRERCTRPRHTASGRAGVEKKEKERYVGIYFSVYIPPFVRLWVGAISCQFF